MLEEQLLGEGIPAGRQATAPSAHLVKIRRGHANVRNQATVDMVSNSCRLHQVMCVEAATPRHGPTNPNLRVTNEPLVSDSRAVDNFGGVLDNRTARSSAEAYGERSAQHKRIAQIPSCVRSSSEHADTLRARSASVAHCRMVNHSHKNDADSFEVS